MHDGLAAAVSTFGDAVRKKFSSVFVRGEPEDQLRAPLDALLHDLTDVVGLHRDRLALVGETSLAALHTRPDYAVNYDQALVGYVEVKAPGKGADPRRYKGHDKEQWLKLKALPNLMYTDGNSFSLWRSGQPVGTVVSLDGDVETSGRRLQAPKGLLALVEDFLRWQPIAPATARELAASSARLCRLLRDEVVEQLGQGEPTLESLATDWRGLLFPEASDAQFADGYAQTVTFGLLLARARNIPLTGALDGAAREVGKVHSLIGTALRVLTDTTALVTSVPILTRVLGVVDWPTISKGETDAWLYFYETFLQEYDPALRKRTGSYYTPAEVVTSMTRLVDEALEHRLGLARGLADSSVTLVDPAMGTGTFLLAVLRAIAARIDVDEGEGARGPQLVAALQRLVGFELQLGPFAVAQLRVLAELKELNASPGPDALRMFVADTLDNPHADVDSLGSLYEPIARSRRAANKVKTDEAVLVVLGNPPWREKAKGRGGWVESGSTGVDRRPPLDDFLPHKDWGAGVHVKHLYNLYVYFWRWATWKVFDAHPEADRGVVCFITVAGFLDGQGFAGMRAYLRRTCDAIWVIDCSPEGHQPPISTRIFQGVQQPVCIVVAVRDSSGAGRDEAPVFFRTLPGGSQQVKFDALAAVTLGDEGWQPCGTASQDPFLPLAHGAWATYPTLDDLLRWSGSGTMPGRTWVVAPDTETLEQRWSALLSAPAEKQPRLMMEHPQDRRMDKVLTDALPGFPVPSGALADERDPAPARARIGFRSFDRQWLIADKRLINRPNPTLWSVRSEQQVFLTALHDTPPGRGPAASFTALVPDLHHFRGNFGGRAYPLWLDAAGTQSNVVPGLLDVLSTQLHREVTAADLFAYLAAVIAHPAYTSCFTASLATPGLRAPLTADASLFVRAVTLGERVLWLHTYGERFTDVAAGRPTGSPRRRGAPAPRVSAKHPIPSSEEGMPDELRHDAGAALLHVGEGVIEDVPASVFAYEVGGVNVLGKWFGYRRRSREKPAMGGKERSDLEKIQSETWRPEYTSELIDLLNVLALLMDCEEEQEALLQDIVDGSTYSVADLTAAGVLPVPAAARKASAHVEQPNLTPGLF